MFHTPFIGYKEFDPYFTALEKAVASNEPTGMRADTYDHRPVKHLDTNGKFSHSTVLLRHR